MLLKCKKTSKIYIKVFVVPGCSVKDTPLGWTRPLGDMLGL